MKKKREKKQNKKSRILALLIAIFFSLFVWLYLKKYKKFFVWLTIMVSFSVFEAFSGIYVYEVGIGMGLVVISRILALVMWVDAISDAWKLKVKDEKTDKRTIILIGLVFFILLLALLSIKVTEKNLNLAYKTNDTFFCKKILYSETKDWCFFKIATNSNNISLCNQTERINECYSIIAQNLQDISICDNINSSLRLRACHRDVNKEKLKLATQTLNVSICINITQDKYYMKGECLCRLAYLTQNKTLCNLIDEKDVYKPRCLKGYTCY